MNKSQIMEILPHRNSMLLLDEVYEEDGEAHGIYNVRGDEFFLDGHFPDFKIVPGVILCEILAQSTCILLKDKMQDGKIALYAGLDKVKFKKPVLPGDKFETKCRITRNMGAFYFAEGEGYVDGELKIKATYSFALADKSDICSQKS